MMTCSVPVPSSASLIERNGPNILLRSPKKWVAVMRSAGFTDDDMHRWHTEFEKSAPAEHQEFLEFLHIPTAEIAKIRDWSRKQ